MTPPVRCSAQPDQARRLSGNAVCGHELLLLADGVEEAERVHAEADQPDDRDGQQTAAGAHGDSDPLAFLRRGEHQERQHQRSCDLDRDPRRDRDRRGAQTRTGAGAEEQREREREQHERVVVRPAHGQRQQHRVQADERRRPAGRLAHALGRASDQRYGREAREHGQRLQHPQAPGQAQRRQRVAGEREQRAVGRVLERPAVELEDRVGRRFRGHVGIGVEPVQGAHPRERQIAEHVLRDQRRPQRQQHVRQHDRRGDRRERKPRRRHEHERVARAHRQHQRLEAGAGEADVQAAQRAGQPCGPTTAAPRHVLRRRRRGPGAQQRDGGHDAEQSERAEDAQRRCGVSPGRCAAPVPRRGARRANGRYRGRCLHRAHCYVSPTCECPVRSITSISSFALRGASAWALARASRPSSRRSRPICDLASANAPHTGPTIDPRRGRVRARPGAETNTRTEGVAF